MSEAMSLRKLSGLLRSGVSLERSLEHIRGEVQGSSRLQYLLAVAEDSGSAVATEIEFVAEILNARERAVQRIEVAHASPKSTARLMLWLPIITLVMAQILGWGVLDAIFQKPVVLLSVGLGLGLLLASKLITTRLLKRSQPSESNVGFYLLGVAVECGAGASLAQAQVRAGAIYQDIFRQSPDTKELAHLKEIESLVNQSGSRAAELLRKQAQAMQEEIQLATEIKIEKLSIKLMLPLGLGVLPAFIFLAIVPLMVTTLGAK